MSEELFINVTATETRVALVEEGILQEIWLDRVSQTGIVGNIYKGVVSRVLPGMQAAFVDIGLDKSAFLHVSDIRFNRPQQADAPESAEPELPPVQSLIREQQEIIVQVIKDPIGTKGARVGTGLSIASRFLVLLPDEKHIGISVRIEDEAERQRLLDVMESLRGPDTEDGFIVRTNAEGIDDFALAADMTFLKTNWQLISEGFSQAGSGLIYRNPSLPLRSVRDLMHTGIDRITTDDPDTFAQLQDFLRRFVPEWIGRLKLHDAKSNLFDRYGIEQELEQALQPRIPLKSGGHLVIVQTEAMITVDVNTGGFVGRHSQAATTRTTNIEAAKAIARQLRLRNLGGIIVIDFIDMGEESHCRQVMEALQDALKRDHARTRVCELSGLGLVEMTRKRTAPSLGQMLCEPCPQCSGKGTIKSSETICAEIIREILRISRQFEAHQLMVVAASVVIDQLKLLHADILSDLEDEVGHSIGYQREDQYGQEQFDVVML